MNKITYKKQSGAVLFISLIMLLLLTLIGVSGMQTTILEEKMAGNYRDQNIAFQAAESTLKFAENHIKGISPTPLPPNYLNLTAGPFLNTAAVEPNYFDPNTWSGTKSKPTLAYVANFDLPEEPRYVIKKIISVPGSLVLGTFRITARAVGKSPGTQVILQEIYERTN